MKENYFRKDQGVWSSSALTNENKEMETQSQQDADMLTWCGNG
jgi:hypothetical protein